MGNFKKAALVALVAAAGSSFAKPCAKPQNSGQYGDTAGSNSNNPTPAAPINPVQPNGEGSFVPAGSPTPLPQTEVPPPGGETGADTSGNSTSSSNSTSEAGSEAEPKSSGSKNTGDVVKFGEDIVKGVNLGGWLVLEPWITPSIFQDLDEVVDEYNIGKKFNTEGGGSEKAKSKLQDHWDTFITEKDIKQIADWGFNLVRLPVGFWAFDTFDSPYFSGQKEYIDNCIEWARAAGLSVLIDLHGAPQSQNGFDNSGQRTEDGEMPQWQEGSGVENTIKTLETISKKYAAPEYDDVIAGIELLNEPMSDKLDVEKLKDFMKDAAQVVKDVSKTRKIVINDAFKPPESWTDILPGDEQVIWDHHEYQIFQDKFLTMTPEGHVENVTAFAAENYASESKTVFVGEWSAAMTDCAFWLNGVGRDSREEGKMPDSTFHRKCNDGKINKDDITTWDQTLKDQTRAYIEAQIEAFETKAKGWVYWTYKTEGNAEWDMGLLIENELFPLPSAGGAAAKPA
ncbi:MAG: exo-1,3-beta-glucanase [Alyxoria varia]|nr:MAG: exo-1,3-beta-glucanase [Alyxoria varia]